MCRVIILTILSAILILPYVNGDFIITEATTLLKTFENVLISRKRFDYDNSQFSTDFIDDMFRDRYLHIDASRLTQTNKIKLFVAYYEYRNKLLNRGINPKRIPLIQQIDETFMEKLCSLGRNSIEDTRKLILYIETLFDKFDIVLSRSGRNSVHNFQNCVEKKGFHVTSTKIFGKYEGDYDDVLQCGREILRSTYFQTLMNISIGADDVDCSQKTKIFDAIHVFLNDTGLSDAMGGEEIMDCIESYTKNTSYGSYFSEQRYVVLHKTIVDFPPSDDGNSVNTEY